MAKYLADEPVSGGLAQLKSVGSNPLLLLRAETRRIAEREKIEPQTLLRDALTQEATEVFRAKVFARLEERGVRHDFGPACAVFQAYGQHFHYVSFGGREFFGLTGVTDPVEAFDKFVCAGLSLVWRTMPEANGYGGFYARLIQVTDPVFDLVTSKPYIDAFMNDTLHEKRAVTG